MFKSYFLSSLRNLKKEALVTAINLLGMATGLAATVVIFLYVSNELDYDNLSDAENIYRLEFQQKSDQSPKWPVVPHTWTDKYAAQIPEIKDYTLIRRSTVVNTIVHGQGRFFEEEVIISSPGIIDMFDLKLVGSALNEPLKGRKKVMLSRSRALSYFENEDPVGKFISINGEDGFLVTGVFEKSVPIHMDFEVIMSVDDTIQRGSFYWLITYLKLSDGADHELVRQKINAIADEFSNPFFSDTEFRLVAMKDIYFDTNKYYQTMDYGDIGSIYIFTVLGLMILVVASLNFVNLTAATFINRAKEVGVRRVLGSTSRQLVGRFLTESGLILLFAYLCGMILVKWTIPLLNKHLGLSLDFPAVTSPVVWLSMMFFLSMVLAVGYYSSHLSKRLKTTKLSGGEKMGRYKSISLLFQFTIATLLIVGMLLVRDQLGFMKNRELGFGKDPVYMINMLNPDLRPNLKEYVNRFSTHPSVISASAMMGSPGDPRLMGNQNVWAEGMPQGENIFLPFYAGDENVVQTLGLDIIDGQDFSQGINVTEGTLAALINESAVGEFGWEDPIGKRMTISGGPAVIVGVVKDFHFQSLQNSIGPVAIVYDYNLYMIALRIQSEGLESALDFVKEEWLSIDPENEIQSFFLEESFNDQYAHEERLATILDMLTWLAVLISAIGTLGMMMLIIKQRTKEVGIRKVLGASLGEIVLLLNRPIFKLLFTANLLAWPIAYYFGNQWLDTFAYKVGLSVGPFLIAGATSSLLVFCALGYHSLKAAVKNPIDSLRYE